MRLESHSLVVLLIGHLWARVTFIHQPSEGEGVGNRGSNSDVNNLRVFSVRPGVGNCMIIRICFVF